MIPNNLSFRRLLKHWLGFSSASKDPQHEAILAAGLFDQTFYLKEYQPIEGQILDPLQHYLETGATKGYSPNPLFDHTYYLSQLTELERSTLNSLYHFVSQGVSKGLNPHPLFDTQYYQSQLTDITELEMNPLAHYLKLGYRKRCDPSPFFNNLYYLSEYADVKEAGLNPLIHYLKQGWKEGRNPSFSFETSFYLENNPDVLQSGRNPLIHYVLCGQYEDRPVVNNAKRFEKLFGPGFLVEYQKVRALVPEIPALNGVHMFLETKTPEISKESLIFPKLVNEIKQPISHLICLDWLVRGGGPVIAINFIKLLSETYGPNSVVLIQTDYIPVNAQDWLPEGVKFINFSELTHGLSKERKRNLLARFILTVKPQVVHNVESRTCWNVYREFSGQLSKIVRLFASKFSHERMGDGLLGGPSITHLNQCIDNLSAVFTDTARFKNDLIELYALEPWNQRKIVVSYTPLSGNADTSKNLVTPVVSDEGNIKKLPVLWASRISPEKRPDILCEIASRLPNQEFQVYGNVSQHSLIERFSAIPNIKLFGEYRSFSEIPIVPYGIFLYTTQFDGLPNVLLEAMMAYQAVIAPDIGGIGELVTDDTGWLIKKNDDVDEYVSCLNQAINDVPERINKANLGRNLVMQRHSWESFRQSMEKIDDYL